MLRTDLPHPPRTPPGGLRLRRLTLGLTQSDLAARSGVARNQITRLEGGQCEPLWRTVCLLAAALDADPAELFPPTHEGRAANATLVETSTDASAGRERVVPA